MTDLYSSGGGVFLYVAHNVGFFPSCRLALYLLLGV